MEIYDAKKDEQFNKPYIDVDEMKIRILDDGTEIPFRFMHGGFEGTDVKFSFSFPEKESYEGRFYQYLSPFPGPDEEMASIPVTGIDDKVAFCITHGAYYVESNMGSKQIFTNSEDKTITYRSSAATAEYSRIMAQKVYGYEHRPFGYVYGGSGGGYRTIGCIENTNAFDGAAPYVIGSPYAIPNCQTTRALATRILRHKIPDIIDAVDAGGSGDPYESLNEEEKKALKEVTLFGYPLKSWFASADLNDGALPVLLPGVKGMDPSYFVDFWTKEGYEGIDPKENASAYRINMSTAVKNTSLLGLPKVQETEPEGESAIDTRNGVNDAWKKMIGSEAENIDPWIELECVPDGENLYLKGCKLKIQSGEAEGRIHEIREIVGNRAYLTDGFGTSPIGETLTLLKQGDEIQLDNSDYIAVQYYHRHQVPTLDYKAWDQFRDDEGMPLYPQQPTLLGPVFSGGGPGCKQNGLINGKIMICASLMDEQAYPWQADWYRRKVASVHDGNEKDYVRLYYFDNTLHDDVTASVDELHATSYIAGLKQVLIDLANWVEKGIEPLPSTKYEINGGHIIISEKANERGGLQSVPNALAGGSKCIHVKAGSPVTLTVDAEVPDGAGSLTYVEWSFEGETDFGTKGKWVLSDGGKRGHSEISHTYTTPGTYFAVVRVKSERNGDQSAPFTQIRNIDRVRIVVEE